MLGQIGGEEAVTLTESEMPRTTTWCWRTPQRDTMCPNGAVPARAHKVLRYASAPDGNTFMNEGW